MAVVTMRYNQSTWSCSQRSGCHRLPPRAECARTETMNAINRVAMSAAMKYTSGMAISPVNNFASTVAVSEMGSDFQNKTLRSLRSAYRQSSEYHVAEMFITTKKVTPNPTS